MSNTSLFCINCKNVNKCGIQYDAESQGMKITYCIRKNQKNGKYNLFNTN